VLLLVVGLWGGGGGGARVEDLGLLAVFAGGEIGDREGCWVVLDGVSEEEAEVSLQDS
jgi:hypothetical protein